MTRIIPNASPPIGGTPFVHWTDLLAGLGIVFLVVILYFLCGRFPALRRVVLRITYFGLRPLIWLTRGLDALVRLFQRPRWHITGRCLRCGECCQLLAMGLSPFLLRRPYLQDIIRWYYEINYGFHFEGLAEERWLLFCCPHLDRNNLCRIYFRRPRICREYPSPYQATRPDVPDACGYQLHDAPAPTTRRRTSGAGRPP